MTISGNLKWNTHIIHNTCKQKLGTLYQNFYQADQKTLSHLYKTLVATTQAWLLQQCLESPHCPISQQPWVCSARLCTRALDNPLGWSLFIAELAFTSLSSFQTKSITLPIRHESIIPSSTYYHLLSQLNPCVHHPQWVTAPFARTTIFQCSFLPPCNSWNGLARSTISSSTARYFKTAISLLPTMSWSCPFCSCILFSSCLHVSTLFPLVTLLFWIT